MEFEELDALYRKMLAPSKSKFTAEVKRLVKDGKVNPQVVGKGGRVCGIRSWVSESPSSVPKISRTSHDVWVVEQLY